MASAFEPAISAAAAEGPKKASPAARTASPRPATSDVSGPQTTRSAFSATAAATSSGTASAPMGTQRVFGTVAMPGLPGATTISSTSRLWASFHASACSRPPDPTKKMRDPMVL